jgi:hypothetical protein
LWQHFMAQSRCSANPLKKILFSRCVNPIALPWEREKGAPRGASIWPVSSDKKESFCFISISK